MCSQYYGLRNETASAAVIPPARAAAGIARLLAVALLAAAAVTAQDRDAEREKREPVAKVLAALRLEKGHRVADVGAGEGFYTERIARAVAPTGRVTAVDIDRHVLKKLEKRIAAAKISNVDVILGQPADPGLDTASYDAVLIYNAYHEMTEHRAMLHHIRASLKPDGRLVIVEPIHDKNRDLPRDRQVADHEIAPEVVEAELHAALFDVRERDESFKRFADPENPGCYWMIVATRAR